MQSEIRNKKPDVDRAVRFIEDVHRLIDRVLTCTTETKKANPTISDDELQKIVGNASLRVIKDVSFNEFSEETVFSLPKPLAKNVVEIGCKLLELNQCEFGSKEYINSLRNILAFLENAGDDLKKVKWKKK